MKTIYPIITLIIVVLISIGYISLSPPKNQDSNQPSVPKTPGETVVPTLSTASRITVQGKIVKEKIPAELELGDYWYWFYFDRPFLLENNASGQPQSVDKLQILPIPGNDIEASLEKHLEITGELTWGYAESSVIQLTSTREIK